MAVMLIAYAVCTLLYRYDNKYAVDSVQPSHGVWDLSEEEFSNSSLYFPNEGWEFYRGMLLTPDDIKNGNNEAEYIDIGEQRSCVGTEFKKGTYRLNVRLPDKKQIYTLYLPEIFNCFRLYVNGEPVLDVGDIDDNRMEMQKRAVTFAASVNAEIVIDVVNTSHFLGGMIYAPVLGVPFAVTTSRGVHVFISVFAAVIGCICFLMSVWLGLKVKQRYDKLFVLFCAAATAYISIDIMYTFIPISTMSIYIVKKFLYYAVFVLILMMQ